MEKNVGTVDRAVRIAVGLGLLSRLRKKGKGRFLGLIGLMPLATGATGKCELYNKLGINTRKY